MHAMHQKLPYEKRFNATLKYMQEKGSTAHALQHSLRNDVLNECLIENYIGRNYARVFSNEIFNKL